MVEPQSQVILVHYLDVSQVLSLVERAVPNELLTKEERDALVNLASAYLSAFSDQQLVEWGGDPDAVRVPFRKRMSSE
jgi:hypothetical protein